MSDILWATDNEYGVPALILGEADLTPPGVVAPVVVWGSTRRSSVKTGTLCFYTDDYRFAGLWNASELPRAGAVCEPNYSVFADTPVAVAMWATYRKRWLARQWQADGATVWVDLCVAREHMWINLLGVPRGWQRYSTAAWDSRVNELDSELETARAHAAGYPFTLLVYGGGKAVREWCTGRPNVVHVGHRSDARKRPGQGSRTSGQ